MRHRTAGIEELKIRVGQVTVFFPQDLMPKGLEEEIIIFIDGLTEKPERTEEVKRKLVLSLILQTYVCFPKSTLIECIIRPYSMSGVGKPGSDGRFWSRLR